MTRADAPPTAAALAAALVFAACAANGTGSSGFTGGEGGSSSGLGLGGEDAIATGTLTHFPAYANTAKYLYGLDPNAPGLGVAKLGAFDCLGDAGQDPTMTDLAVDATGAVWALGATHLHRIEVTQGKAHCASSVPLVNPKDPANVAFFGLTFAPAGVLDDADETLVAGNTAGELYAIDRATGTLTPRGTLGLVPKDDGHGHAYPIAPSITGDTVGTPWELSGDLVFLANGKSPIGFATVRDCKAPPSPDACDDTDTLVEIDLAKLKTATTEPVVKAVRGAVVAIDNTDGGACLLLQRKTPWYGAGVTTLVPVIPPPR